MFHELFIKDWLWKLFSLLLAVAIWFTVHRAITQPVNAINSAEARKITYGSVPVSVVSGTADVRLYRIVPTEVKVIVSGSQDATDLLTASQIRATVDLTGFDPQKDLKADVEVSMPPGITLISVEPPRVGVIPPPASSN